MVMSTQTLASASAMMSTLLVDEVDIYLVGEPETVGFEVTRPLYLFDQNIAALVQTTVLANTVESQVTNIYSVKVGPDTNLEAGMAVEVTRCTQEPSLVGKTLLIDKVSQNGIAMLTKAVASDFHQVDQQGKGAAS